MLFGVFTAISALAAMASCLGAGAFGGFGWLWLLPVSFLGTYLCLILIWFLMMVVMAALVKMDEPRQKDDPLYRWVIDETIRLVITLLRVRVHTQGLEKAPKEGRFVLVCNHISDVDPAFLLGAFPKRQLAFISKRENDKKFLIGPFLHQVGCQPINRENDREALKTILKCVQMIQADAACIGVFPEGYVSKDRKLHPFRHGVFKIAQRAQVSILVCTLRGTHRVLPNALRLKATDVELHLVDVIPAQELEGVTAVAIGERVHAMMAQDLGAELVLQE